MSPETQRLIHVLFGDAVEDQDAALSAARHYCRAMARPPTWAEELRAQYDGPRSGWRDPVSWAVRR